MPRNQIEEILRDELERARTRHTFASAALHAVLAQPATGIPDDYRIGWLAVEKEAAVRELALAVSRFNGLILRDEVPEDLRRLAKATVDA
jgi:hypothetical protein